MTKISDAIKNHKDDFLKHELFQHLKNDSLSLNERLKFLPFISHFVMSFSDINHLILPFKFPKNELEKAVNRHALEDSEHWPWYLNDLENLSLNPSATFTDHLHFIWSDKLLNSRMLTYRLVQLLSDQPAEMRLIIIEVMEATGNAMFDTLASITQGSDKELEYCGKVHLSHETGHSIGSDDELIDTLKLSDKEREKAITLIDECFMAFHGFFDEINNNVKNIITTH
jgi:hypothetical protein